MWLIFFVTKQSKSKVTFLVSASGLFSGLAWMNLEIIVTIYEKPLVHPNGIYLRQIPSKLINCNKNHEVYLTSDLPSPEKNFCNNFSPYRQIK